MTFASSLRWLTRLSVVSLVLLSLTVADVARAESDVKDTGFRDTTIVDDTLLKSGRMEVTIQSAGLFSHDSGGEGDGTDAKFTSLYINPEVAFGYMVLDELQVRGTLGWLKIYTSNGDVDLQDLNAGMGTVQGLYHVALPYGTALYLGAGGGYFYGGTQRPGPTETSTVSNTTSGFVAQGLAGLLLQPGPRVTLRAGLRLDALFSSEQPQDEAADAIKSINFKSMGQFGVGFRF